MNKTLTGLAAAAIAVLALSACASSGAPTTSSAPPAGAGTPTASSSAWYPQAVPDSTIPDPNRPSRTYASVQAIGAAMGWKSVFAPGPDVNAQGQLIYSYSAMQANNGESWEQPGDVEETFDGYGTGSDYGDMNDLGTQQDVFTFPSPAAEQALIAYDLSGSENDGPIYLLAGQGWVLFDGDDTTDAQAAQKVLGGSYLTLNDDQVVGFQ
jgi:hypothetical protein